MLGYTGEVRTGGGVREVSQSGFDGGAADRGEKKVKGPGSFVRGSRCHWNAYGPASRRRQLLDLRVEAPDDPLHRLPALTQAQGQRRVKSMCWGKKAS